MADRRLVIDFNRAFAAEPTPEEKQLVNELLSIWGKLEPAAAKSPAAYRKGILFGMALQKAISGGEIIIRPVKEKRPETKPKMEQ